MTTLAPTSSITQADSDEMLIGLWLHGRPAHTRRAYAHDIARFRSFTSNAPFAQLGLHTLQQYADSLTTAKHRALAALKSLYAFGHRLGYLPFDTGRALRVQNTNRGLKAERILSEAQVHAILEHAAEHKTMLRFLYVSGVRVSELVSLRWRDCTDYQDGGIVSVLGKGNKVRVINIPAAVWSDLIALRAEPDAKLFNVNPTTVFRIMRRAAKKAGIVLGISAHWFRHSHASHALDAGAPISVVQKTLGHASLETTGKYLHARPHESAGMWLKVPA